MNTIKNSLNNVLHRLQNVSSSPQLDALLLLETATGLSRTQLIKRSNRPLTLREEYRLSRMLWQRLNHYPVSYIHTYQEFYTYTFRVEPGVLCPRPETEHLVERVSSYISSLSYSPRILEIGTGSGCISVTLAKEHPHIYNFEATDISSKALQIALWNANLHVVGNRIRFTHKNLLRTLPWYRPDIIIANLPYLDRKRHNNPSLQKEPSSHLYSSQKGRGHYRKLFTQLSQSGLFEDIPLFGEALPTDMEDLHKEAIRIFGKNVFFTTFDSFVFQICVPSDSVRKKITKKGGDMNE